MKVFDTDVVIDLIRKHPPALAWAQTLGSEELVIPGFVAMELTEGCLSKRDLVAIEKTLRPFRIAWPTEDRCNAALDTLRQLGLSHGIGMADVLIAQTAMMLGLPLHTFNRKHFNAVNGLQTVQPYNR